MARPRWRINLAYRVVPRVSIGAEINPAVNEVLPTANWVAHPETAKVPLISFGTSSDRIFTPEGKRAYFVSFAKGLPGTSLAPYLSLNYSEFERKMNFPFGVNVALGLSFDFLLMNDGRRTHSLITFKTASTNYTLMLIDLKRPRIGFSVGIGF